MPTMHPDREVEEAPYREAEEASDGFHMKAIADCGAVELLLFVDLLSWVSVLLIMIPSQMAFCVV